MQADEFLLYAYASVMLQILVAMLIGLLLLRISNYNLKYRKDR